MSAFTSSRAESRDRRGRSKLLPYVVALFASAMSPFEKNDPNVDEGMSAFEKGQYEQALSAFEAASREHPTDARAQFNRGTALHKLKRNDEAKQAFTQAEALDKGGSLKNKIHYNLGNVAAEEQKREEAIAEYRKALRADPNDGLSRHNLEVVLKNLPPKDQNGPDGGTPPDAGPKDAGTPDSGTTDAGRDAGSPDGGPRDAGQNDGGQSSDAGRDGGADGGNQQADSGQPNDGGKGDAGDGEQENKKDGGSQGDKTGDAGSDGGVDQQDGGIEEAAPAKGSDGGMDMSKKEAEKLLDAFKSNEKNMQLWRFKQKTKQNDNHGKDW